MLFDSSPCQKLSHLLGPLPSNVTYFMDGPQSGHKQMLCNITKGTEHLYSAS